LDTNTVIHQQHYEDKILLSPKSNAKMITVTTSVIDAEWGEPNDTRDTTIEDNHHLNKTRKPKHNMNQATMMDAPSYEQKENTTYKEWTNKHDDKEDWTTVLFSKRKSKMNQTTLIRPPVPSLGRGGGLTTIYQTQVSLRRTPEISSKTILLKLNENSEPNKSFGGGGEETSTFK
jgi:hypothetical protein